MAGLKDSGMSEARLDRNAVDNLVHRPSLEKSIAPLRSFGAEPMLFGRMFLAATLPTTVPSYRRQGPQPRLSDVSLSLPFIARITMKDLAPASTLFGTTERQRR